MKNIFCYSFIFVLLLSSHLLAQSEADKAISSIPITMLFPEGKSKALLLSYDDGNASDRRMVALLNNYQLKGTFHLNSNKFDTDNYLKKAEIKTLFEKHEVSVHSANHPFLTNLSKIDVVYEIVEDRRALERLSGQIVRGMAYPFGNYNETVIEYLSGLGIEYARTVEDTYDFKIPVDFLKWHPTMHQFGKAYQPNNTPDTDKKELTKFYQTISDFLQTKELALLDIWGHSWEMGSDENKWKETEKFIKMLANNPEICYATQIELVDYIKGFNTLKFSVNKTKVTNLSALTIYFKKNNKTYKIEAGKTIDLQ